VRILVIDIGGTHVKLLATGQDEPTKIDSGPDLTPRAMAASVRDATADWSYEVISIGYPGPVLDGRPAREPHNLGEGWMRFGFAKAFGRPVRIVNDATMQAIGSYDGGRMLFLGLGTGLGSALIVDGTAQPLELAHLPYREGRTYEEYLGADGMERLGKKKWRRHVDEVAAILRAGMQADYVVLGGGNVKQIDELPEGARRGDNRNAFTGGFRLWEPEHGVHLPRAVLPDDDAPRGRRAGSRHE